LTGQEDSSREAGALRRITSRPTPTNRERNGIAVAVVLIVLAAGWMSYWIIAAASADGIDGPKLFGSKRIPFPLFLLALATIAIAGGKILQLRERAKRRGTVIRCPGCGASALAAHGVGLPPEHAFGDAGRASRYFEPWAHGRIQFGPDVERVYVCWICMSGFWGLSEEEARATFTECARDVMEHLAVTSAWVEAIEDERDHNPMVMPAEWDYVPLPPPAQEIQAIEKTRAVLREHWGLTADPSPDNAATYKRRAEQKLAIEFEQRASQERERARNITPMQTDSGSSG
jgi:hypothetical protein